MRKIECNTIQRDLEIKGKSDQKELRISEECERLLRSTVRGVLPLRKATLVKSELQQVETNFFFSRLILNFCTQGE